MDVEPAFVADGEAAEFVELGDAALAGPSMPPNLATVRETAAATVIAGVVCMQLVRSASWSAPLFCSRWDGVDQILEWRAVMDVGSGQAEGERNGGIPPRSVIKLRLVPGLVPPIACRRGPLLPRWTSRPRRHGTLSIRSASRNRRRNSRCKAVPDARPFRNFGVLPRLSCDPENIL